jgi:hypothetical protein
MLDASDTTQRPELLVIAGGWAAGRLSPVREPLPSAAPRSARAGRRHARLRPPEHPLAPYVGSWSNWSADPARPAATAATP